MEVEEIQRQVCKIPRLGNGAPPDSGKIVRGGSDNYPDDEEEGGALIKRTASVVGDGGAAAASALRGWHHHHSSRIIRVSRATGGKDRHSKVLTSRGLRDRRVRLSVTTAIQFYDLQDRLGYDQPSKAVEWLIKAAADAIAELPSLNPSNIPDTPRQLSDEKRVSDGTEQEVGTEPDGSEPTTNNFHQQNSQSQHLSLSKSACSSASDTSKNSGLTLARSDVRAGRAKARERARERTAKEKEKEQDQPHINHFSHQNSSFTELLTCGIGSNNSHNPPVSAAAPMDYFSGALFGAGASSRNPHSSSGFPGQIQLGTSLAQTMSNPTPFSISGDSSSSNNHPELQHYSFVPDHLFPVAATTASQQQQHEYNLNFSISPGLAVFNRGTLQSNSPSLLPHHLQRLSSPLDAPPFFISTSAVDHHNHNQQHQQFPTGFDGRALQLCYGDGTRDSDHKLKPRN